MTLRRRSQDPGTLCFLERMLDKKAGGTSLISEYVQGMSAIPLVGCDVCLVVNLVNVLCVGLTVSVSAVVEKKEEILSCFISFVMCCEVCKRVFVCA